MRKGQKTSDETKRKISEALKKISVASRFQKGNKIGPRFKKGMTSLYVLKSKGKKLTDNHKNNLKIAKMLSLKRPFEAKNSNWKGGKSLLSMRIRRWGEYNRWREKIFKRDGFICKKCGSKENIEPHHIIAIDVIVKDFNLRNREDAIKCLSLWDPENGITLCKKCHWGAHGFKKWK